MRLTSTFLIGVHLLMLVACGKQDDRKQPEHAVQPQAIDLLKESNLEDYLAKAFLLTSATHTKSGEKFGFRIEAGGLISSYASGNCGPNLSGKWRRKDGILELQITLEILAQDCQTSKETRPVSLVVKRLTCTPSASDGQCQGTAQFADGQEADVFGMSQAP